jgi:hypothetical protein
LALLEQLKKEAVARGFIDEETKLDAARVFSLVRDMNLRRATSSDLISTILEWRGSEISKHRLLNELLSELGLDTRLMMCTCEFTKENSEHLPRSLQVQLSAGPIPDVHSFVRIEHEDSWMDVDATWPQNTRNLGMPVNERFEMGDSMALACEPIEIFYVPADSDPYDFRDKLVKTHCAGQYRSRLYFIQVMQKWLHEESSRKSA